MYWKAPSAVIATTDTPGALKCELEHHWKVLLAELDLRPLDKMLPGVVTTPLGIANWLFERITANYPGVMAVRVSDGTIWGEKSRR